mmetsp:Transcript_51239/g.89462  ORF Transcript_51239/g.89462 Transcript_51239/m.89462 type:complete len:101 (-) Transcript_51239:416-718(-)
MSNARSFNRLPALSVCPIRHLSVSPCARLRLSFAPLSRQITTEEWKIFRLAINVSDLRMYLQPGIASITEHPVARVLVQKIEWDLAQRIRGGLAAAGRGM